MCQHYATHCFVTVGSERRARLPVLMRLYRESRRCSALTPDKCFIQMLLSHIVEEVMNSCAAAAGPVHRVKPEHGAGTAPQQQN